MTVPIGRKTEMEGNLPFQNWHKESYRYSEDELINAFEKGQEKALSQREQAINNHFQTNVEKATESAEELAEKIKEEFDIFIKGMHMKISSMNEYSIILGISGEDYFSEVMDTVYEFVNEKEQNLTDDQFSIDFKFIFTNNEHLNRDGLIADGYILYYNPEESRDS